MSTLARRSTLGTAGLAALTLLAACGGGSASSTGSAAGSSSGTSTEIAVAAGDDACEVGADELVAGTHRFTVTNTGSQTTEFYVYRGGSTVVAEVENIAPGVSRQLLVDLAEGEYETVCKPGMIGDGIRNDLTVTASGEAAAADPRLARAGAGYQAYVQQQTAELVARTTEFVAAVQAGDVATAQALYPVARLPWERIEPVAESFGDLDPRIDGRDGDQAEGEDFTGFHRIEQALWETGEVAAMGPVADQLLADVQEIATEANQVTLSPLQLANGAKALLDEIATGKVTGEEERYSHTDLWDVAGNLEGSQVAIEQLRPYLAETDPELMDRLDEQFAATRAELARYAVGAGYLFYDQLTTDQVQGLADAVTALTEPVSQVAAAVAEQ